MERKYSGLIGAKTAEIRQRKLSPEVEREWWKSFFVIMTVSLGGTILLLTQASPAIQALLGLITPEQPNGSKTTTQRLIEATYDTATGHLGIKDQQFLCPDPEDGWKLINYGGSIDMYSVQDPETGSNLRPHPGITKGLHLGSGILECTGGLRQTSAEEVLIYLRVQ